MTAFSCAVGYIFDLEAVSCLIVYLSNGMYDKQHVCTLELN